MYQPGCNRMHPNIGMEGTRKAEYCTKHAKQGMVKVKPCWYVYPGCAYNRTLASKEPRKGILLQARQEGNDTPQRRGMRQSRLHGSTSRYGMKGDKKKYYCGKHVKSGMVDPQHKYCCVSPHVRPPRLYHLANVRCGWEQEASVL